MYSAVRISKCKNIFAKGYTPNWSGEVSVILIKIKTMCQGHMYQKTLMVKKLYGDFIKKNCKKQIKKSLKLKK